MSSPAKGPTKTDEVEKKGEAEEGRKRKKPDSGASNDPNAEASTSAKDADGKNWKRILANRKSARDSRIRRIKYMETLETSVEELTRENSNLIRENQALARENFFLRQQQGLGGGGGGNVGMVDAPAGRDEAPYHQPMGARPGHGLLPGEGVPRFPGGMSPSSPSMANSRSALTRPILDMPHPGLDMPIEPTGFRSAMQTMPSSAPHTAGASAYGGALDMIRNRRSQSMISNPPIPTEEEQRILNIMRRGQVPK